MTKFRPCIDLHAGQVKQIVGGTLSDNPDSDTLKTNYVSKHPAGHYANLYKESSVEGAHVIMLGPENDTAAREALGAWPGHLQVGGGINDTNAPSWIDAGASKVYPRYFVPGSCRIYNPSYAPIRVRAMLRERLRSVLSSLSDDKDKLVIDLSCRRKDQTWFVAMNKWQTITEMEITKETIALLEPYCSEFLIHAADNEGLQQGIDVELVTRLSEWCSIPVTYAGGARTVEDLELVKSCSHGKIDLTIGSALDVFGGSGCSFEECVAWNKKQPN